MKSSAAPAPIHTPEAAPRAERPPAGRRTQRRTAFDVDACLGTEGAGRRIVTYRTAEIVFAQGDACDDVRYLQRGGIKLSVHSQAGKDAVVAMLQPGDFFGEGTLAGQSIRFGTATAMMASSVLIIEKQAMSRLLHERPEVSNRFIAHMLARNIRCEADLVDQLSNSSEKRLARTLLMLARYGEQMVPAQALPRISQETLAEMIGTTRSRVNLFMNRFRKRGFVQYDGDLRINAVGLSDALENWE